METNRIIEYIKSGKHFSFTKNEVKYLTGLVSNTHVEPRVRKDDLTEALSLRVYDPLWMLSRQWQMGEFRGNNAGTAVSVKCRVSKEDMSKDPIEPATEQFNSTIDLLVRVESAMFYIKLLGKPEDEEAQEQYRQTHADLRTRYPIDWESFDKYILDCDATKEEEKRLNAQRMSFAKSFRDKAFDGYKLYCDIKKGERLTDDDRKYTDWFEKTYLCGRKKNNENIENIENNENNHWQEQALNYQIKLETGNHYFMGDRYQGGRLSWYSVDQVNTDNQVFGKQETIASLPTPVHYPGAPNKRLWQFEDRRVYLGNSTEQQSKANEMFLKFATLYSNDWMLIPLQTDIGKYIVVNEIEVKNTFGVTQIIKRRAGFNDSGNPLDEPWQMFTNTEYSSTEGKVVDNGLFYAPQLVNTLEGKPVEEVELLRDEMANMVWGVESIVSDGCGFTVDEKLKAVQLKTFVDDLYENNRPKAEPGKVTFSAGNDPGRTGGEESAFRYTLQTHVPFNWIPFIPEHLKDRNAWGSHFDLWGREMVLRRGRMPCYVYNNNKFERYAVLPVTSILRKGLDGDDYKPMLINEEEVQQTGIRLTKNYQRARWLNGKTYLWLGMYKKLAKFSEMSGLEFDTLQKK